MLGATPRPAISFNLVFNERIMYTLKHKTDKAKATPAVSGKYAIPTGPRVNTKDMKDGDIGLILWSSATSDKVDYNIILRTPTFFVSLDNPQRTWSNASNLPGNGPDLLVALYVPGDELTLTPLDFVLPSSEKKA